MYERLVIKWNLFFVFMMLLTQIIVWSILESSSNGNGGREIDVETGPKGLSILQHWDEGLT